MGTGETGSRPWPMHEGAPLPTPPPSIYSTSTTPSASQEPHGPPEPRNNPWAADSSSKPDSLPSIAYLDLHRSTSMQTSPGMMAAAATTGTRAANPSLVSPTSSHHHHQSFPSSEHISPPRPEDQARKQQHHHQHPQFGPSQRPPVSQTLPSIHEALGSLSSPPQQGPHPSVNISGSLPHRSSDSPAGPPNPFSNPPTQQQQQPSSYYPPQDGREAPQRSSIASNHSQDSTSRSMPSFSSGRSPTQNIQTTASSSSSSSSVSGQNPALEPVYAMPSSASYASYPQPQPQAHHHHQPPQPPAYPSQMGQDQRTMAYTSPVSFESRPGGGAQWTSSANPPEIMQVDQTQRIAHRASAPLPCSESVKRYLENYDVEASLNELAEASGRTLDFSRVYAARAQQASQSGPLAALPSLSEVENMIQLQRRSSDALTRLRNAVLNQEHVLAEQQQQSHRQEHVRPYQEEPKPSSSATGSDTKKRRGKAAPPGRCHSCNRAETPEWRRGPDGARTLCNACGLHYAKLTRKMGASKASALGSNFRPRSVEMRTSTQP
ncbi:hypothetical protein VTO42DRAFT_2961 [Malbranchea cinnamomea]